MTALDLRRLAVRVAVALGAFLVALFVTFNSLFSDGPTAWLDQERLVTYAISLVAHGLLAALGARFGGDPWRRWAALASAPSVVVALAYAVRETGIVGLALLYVIIAVAGAMLSAWLARPRPAAATA